MKLKVSSFLTAWLCLVWINVAAGKATVDELRAKADNDPVAASELAEVLMQDIQANEEEISKLCRFASSKGLARGKFLLGRCYGEGIGVKKNLRQAFALYKQAATDGEPAAMNAVGLCYTSGIGTKTNALEAYVAFVESALLNNRDAKYNLGRVYEKGLGVEANLKTALYWYGQAAEQGHSQAVTRLNELNNPGNSDASPPPAVGQTNATLSNTNVSTPTTSDIGKLSTTTQEKNTPSTNVPASVTPTPSNQEADESIRLSIPKRLGWMIGGGILAVCLGGWGFHRWRKKGLHSPSNNHHHEKDAQKTFSCIQCGQLLLIPNYSSRKLLECPACHSDYEVWKDKNGVLHLQNRNERSGMKTYISFGEEASMQSPFHILGVKENCSLDEARDAFRKKMKEYHPDRVEHLGQELRDLAALKAREINEAYNLVVQQKQL